MSSRYLKPLTVGLLCILEQLESASYVYNPEQEAKNQENVLYLIGELEVSFLTKKAPVELGDKGRDNLRRYISLDAFSKYIC